MKNKAKTIQLFLPSGDPTGIRVAEITTGILRVIEVPRSDLEAFFEMPESSQVGVYFLFGEDGKAYIGQSGDLKSRLRQHHKEKEFWNKAVVVFSLTNNLTQTHAQAPLAADCELFFEQMAILIGTLNYPIFKALTNHQPKTEELFYCQRNGVDGQGIYTNEGFVVLKGSKGRADVPDSIKGSMPKRREELLASGDATIDGNYLVLQKDTLFNSPSGASFFLDCMSSNGWVEWKDKNGTTLSDLKRK